MNTVLNTDNGDSIYLLPFLKEIYQRYGSCGYIYPISDPGATTHYSKKKNLLYDILYEQPYITKFGFIDKIYNRQYFYQSSYILQMQDLPEITEIHFDKNQTNVLELTDMDCGYKGIYNYNSSNQINFIPNFYFNAADTTTYIKPLSQLAVDRFSFGECFKKRWIHLNEHKTLHDKKIAIGRSARYNEDNEIMKFLVNKLGKENFIFLGLPEEHQSFCDHIEKIDYLQTDTLLQVAQALNTTELYIGNQSCIMAIAEGLKLNIIQESSKRVPNCNFSRYRDNFYCVVKENNEIIFINDSLQDDEKDFFGIKLLRRTNNYDFVIHNHIYPSKSYKVLS